MWWTILWYLGVGVVLLVLFLLVCFAMLIQVVRHQADKLMFGLPWLKWMTLEDTCNMGFSKFWCRGLLPVFYEQGYLEVRPIGDLGDHGQEIVDALGFHPMTVEFHEFRLTKRKNRKKKWSWGNFSDSWNVLKPA